MTRVNNYQDLVIWQRSHRIVLLTIILVKKLPKEQVANIIATQVIRSVTSTPANISEGFGRYEGKEYKRFLQIALGSAHETDYWLKLLGDIYPFFGQEVEKVRKLNSENCKIIAASINTLNRRKS